MATISHEELKELPIDDRIDILKSRMKELTELARAQYPDLPDWWIEMNIGKYIREEEPYLIPEEYLRQIEEAQKLIPKDDDGAGASASASVKVEEIMSNSISEITQNETDKETIPVS